MYLMSNIEVKKHLHIRLVARTVIKALLLRALRLTTCIYLNLTQKMKLMTVTKQQNSWVMKVKTAIQANLWNK